MQRATVSITLALLWASFLSSGQVSCDPRRTSTEGPATNPCAPIAEPDVTVAYEAVTADGHYVVVLGTPGSESRVFYGTAHHMIEGRITGRSESCVHEVRFDVAGRSYLAVFAPASCSGVQSQLTIVDPNGSRDVIAPLTVLTGVGRQSDAGAAPSAANLEFFCL